MVATEMTVAQCNTVVQFNSARSTDGHSDVDTQVARRVGKKSCDIGIEDEAVAGCNSGRDSVVHTARRRFPCQTTLHAIQLKSDDKTKHPTFIIQNK